MRLEVLETLQWTGCVPWLRVSDATSIQSRGIRGGPQLKLVLLTFAVQRVKYSTAGLRRCPRGARLSMSAVLSSRLTSKSSALLRTLSPAGCNEDDLLLDICNSNHGNITHLREALSKNSWSHFDLQGRLIRYLLHRPGSRQVAILAVKHSTTVA